MTYQPIGNYGLIGNMRTSALVGMNGSIDWFCYPHFDSPSVFGAILDDAKGGRFRIAPTTEARHKQFYWPDTNVLVTRFLNDGGIGEVLDYMPVGTEDKQTRLIRQVQVLRGSMTFRLHCEPAFDYARGEHTVELTENGAVFAADGLRMALSAPVEVESEAGAAVATFTLTEGDVLTFVFQETGEGCQLAPTQPEAEHLFDTTVAYWRKWLSQCTYEGRWREVVYRSALAMKLMTFEETGAIVAAPTTSLPEHIGGVRNWDYRYTWMRDAAFTLYAFIRIGFTDEADAFFEWLSQRTRELDDPNDPLQPLYGIHGEHELTEHTLEHLEGYRGSQPVRIGNAAYAQFQLDIYGALLDAAYLYNKYGEFIDYDLWQYLRQLVDWVCNNWQRKDLGIWEVRAEKQAFVYSKVMCWLAIDRGLRIIEKRSFPADHAQWVETRDRIYEEIQAKGWDKERQTYTQHYNTDALDASNLMMPLTFFTSPTGERTQEMLEAIMQPPEKGGLMAGEMVYRYNLEETPDGLPGEEGTFNMCTFWLVEALTRAGQVDQARLIFERMLGYANHLGLYAEQTSPSGEALGNFPQAFTHLSLISATINLDRALGGSA